MKTWITKVDAAACIFFLFNQQMIPVWGEILKQPCYNMLLTKKEENWKSKRKELKRKPKNHCCARFTAERVNNPEQMLPGGPV